MPKTMGMVAVAALAANAEGAPPLVTDHGDPPTNQIGGHRWQSIELILSEAVFDRHVFALDVADVL